MKALCSLLHAIWVKLEAGNKAKECHKACWCVCDRPRVRSSVMFLLIENTWSNFCDSMVMSTWFTSNVILVKSQLREIIYRGDI